MSQEQDRESARDIFRKGTRDFSRFKTLSGHDIAKLDPPEMLVEGLIPAKSVIGITADAGTGKSWMAMDLMRALIEGSSFLGRQVVVGPAPVLFVGFDSSEHDYGRQWRRITHKWEPTPAAYDDDDERQREEGDRFAEEMRATGELRSRADWLIHPDDLMLDNPEHVADLIDYILSLNKKHSDELDPDIVQNPDTGDWEDVVRQVGVGLVVIDTFGAGVGGEFLHPTVQRTVLRDLRGVTEETRVSILVLHHSAGPNESRPATNWAGGVFGRMGLDVWLHLKKLSGDNNRKVIEVQVEKFRGISPKNFRFTLDVGDPQRADLIAESDAENQQRISTEKVQEALREKRELDALQRVYSQLGALGRFTTRQCMTVLASVLPGWKGKRPATLERDTRKWLKEQGAQIQAEGENTARRYRVARAEDSAA